MARGPLRSRETQGTVCRGSGQGHQLAARGSAAIRLYRVGATPLARLPASLPESDRTAYGALTRKYAARRGAGREGETVRHRHGGSGRAVDQTNSSAQSRAVALDDRGISCFAVCAGTEDTDEGFRQAARRTARGCASGGTRIGSWNARQGGVSEKRFLPTALRGGCTLRSLASVRLIVANIGRRREASNCNPSRCAR